MASNSVQNLYRKAWQDFTGGLSTRANPLQISMNKFAQLQNCIINDHDILEKSQGYTLDGSPFPNTPDSFIRMLVNYKVGTSVSTLVCAGRDDGNTNATYKVDIKQSYGDGKYNYIGHTIGTATFTQSSSTVTGIGTSWTKHLKAGDKVGVGTQPTVWYEIQSVNSDTSITLTSNYLETTATGSNYMARIVLNKDYIPVGLVFNNNLIISNGSDGPMETNNTSLGKLQSVNWQTVNLLELHKNRVFGANWPASPSGLMWTAANDETTVDAASRTTIFAQDNGQVVAIKSFANSLLAFKDNGSVYQITGEFDQDAVGAPSLVRRIDMPDNVGVISGKSVCILEDNSGAQGYQRLGSKVYFLSETGIYTINSWMQVQKVSWDIQPTLANILLKSTATTTKQYAFTDKSQWDSGTINSLSDSRLTNGISSFFDSNVISGAIQANGAVSTFIDSSNDVHTAYITPDSQTIRYNHWLASDNTTVDTQVLSIGIDAIVTTTYTGMLTVDSVAIATAANGNVGIVSKFHKRDTNAGGGGEGSPYYFFSEFTSGSWTHTLIFSVTDTDLNAIGQGVKSLGYRFDAVGLAVNYDGSSNPSVILGQGYGSANANSNFVDAGVSFYVGWGVTYLQRTLGVWGSQGKVASNRHALALDYTIDSGGNLYVAIATSPDSHFGATTNHSSSGSLVEVWKSTDGGATWNITTNGAITPSGTNPGLGVGNIAVVTTNLNDPVVIYNFTSGTGGTTGQIVRVNLASNVQSIVDSSASYLKGYRSNSGLVEFQYSVVSNQEKFIFQTAYQGGTATFTNGSKTVTGTNTKWTTWIQPGDVMKVLSDEEADYGVVGTVNSDNSITLVSNYAGTTQASPAAYIARRTLTVTNSTSSTASNSFFVGNHGLHNNANAVACATFGSSANTLLIRRVTLFGQWTSSVLSDSTLTQWSTYLVGNPISNSNLIQYEVGVNTGSPITDDLIYPIVPGTVISTNITDIAVKARLTFTLQTFAAASVQSLLLNYVATGIDAKVPFGYVFNNEMYLSVTAPSGAGNNEIIFLDRAGAWGTFSQGSCAMTRYNNQLYVGDSQGGNIFKFRQGYDFNGSSYSMVAVSKEDLLGSMELQKEVYKVYVIYETQQTGTFTFSYRLDNFLTSGGSNWVDEVIDHTKGSVHEISSISGQPLTSVQFKIEQDDADVQVGIVGFMVLYKYLNLR